MTKSNLCAVRRTSAPRDGPRRRAPPRTRSASRSKAKSAFCPRSLSHRRQSQMACDRDRANSSAVSEWPVVFVVRRRGTRREGALPSPAAWRSSPGAVPGGGWPGRQPIGARGGDWAGGLLLGGQVVGEALAAAGGGGAWVFAAPGIPRPRALQDQSAVSHCRVRSVVQVQFTSVVVAP